MQVSVADVPFSKIQNACDAEAELQTHAEVNVPFGDQVSVSEKEIYKIIFGDVSASSHRVH